MYAPTPFRILNLVYFSQSVLHAFMRDLISGHLNLQALLVVLCRKATGGEGKHLRIHILVRTFLLMSIKSKLRPGN